MKWMIDDEGLLWVQHESPEDRAEYAGKTPLVVLVLGALFCYSWVIYMATKAYHLVGLGGSSALAVVGVFGFVVPMVKNEWAQNRAAKDWPNCVLSEDDLNQLQRLMEAARQKGIELPPLPLKNRTEITNAELSAWCHRVQSVQRGM